MPLLLITSLGLHAALVAGFHSAPAATMSVGEEVISIELVVGADSPAGAAPRADGAQEAAAPDMPVEKQQDQVIDDTAKPREETTVEAGAEPPPEAVVPEPSPAEPLHREEPVVAVVEPKPEPPPLTAPKVEQERPREKQQSKPAAPSSHAAAGGVGRGRSASDLSYIARVVAHLARFKRFPAEARRTPGTATVSFSIDGQGHVTAATLASSSGQAALDREAVALARRASPFPPPPSGQPRAFTAPVSFEFR